jgi:hypothetical protein
MSRRTITISVSILVTSWIAGAILFLLLRQDASAEHYLRGGEMVNIDFGFPAVAGYDFTAESEVILTNKGDKPIRIEKIRKSCACQRLLLKPEEVVLPGQDLRVRFVHSNATNGKGGYFFDRILLRISDGQDQGDVSLNYSGFVNKISHTVPQQIEFRNQHRATSSEAATVLVFLSRLQVDNGRCSLTPRGTMRVAKVPQNVQVQLIGEEQMPEIRKVCPRTILPHPRMWTYRGGTRTEQELERFFGREFPGGADSIWQPYTLQVQVKDIAGPMEDVIILQTNTTEVRLPIAVSVLPDLDVQPKEITLLATANSVASVHLRNTTKGALNVRSLASDNPYLDLRFERFSPTQVRIVVRWRGGQPTENSVHTTIRVKTNIGDTEVPFVLLALGGTS